LLSDLRVLPIQNKKGIKISLIWVNFGVFLLKKRKGAKKKERESSPPPTPPFLKDQSCAILGTSGEERFFRATFDEGPRSRVQ
jgi:hypothetical protein